MKYADYQREHPAFLIEVEAAKYRAFRHHNKLTDLYRDTTRSARAQKRDLIWRLLVRNADFRLYFAWKAVVATQSYSSYPPERVIELSRRLHLGREIRERSRKKVERRNGKTRSTVSFGLQRRAGQLMVRDILEAMYVPHPDQWTLKGGAPAALKAVVEAIRAGYHFGKELDIPNFFPSIRWKSVFDVCKPIPGDVIRHTVLIAGHPDPVRGKPILPRERAKVPLPAGPSQGLPQGSSCSDITAQMIIADVLRKLPKGIRVSVCGDNIMVMGLTKQDVEQGTTILATLLRKHLVGAPALKGERDPVLDLRSDPFVFMKQEGTCTLDEKGEWVVQWMPASWKLDQIEREIESRKSRREKLVAMIKKVEGWISGYQCWNGRETWVALRVAQLRAKLLCRTKDEKERAVLTKEIIGNWRALGECIPFEELLPPAPWPGRKAALKSFLEALVPPKPKGLQRKGASLVRLSPRSHRRSSSPPAG